MKHKKHIGHEEIAKLFLKGIYEYKAVEERELPLEEISKQKGKELQEITQAIASLSANDNNVDYYEGVLKALGYHLELSVPELELDKYDWEETIIKMRIAIEIDYWDAHIDTMNSVYEDWMRRRL